MARHLYLSYSPDYLDNQSIDTIQEHIRVEHEKSEVIWGQFTTNVTQNRFMPDKIKVLDKQVESGIPTYVYFHSSGKGDEKLYIADYVTKYGRKDISSADMELIPNYYHDKVNRDPEPGVLTCKSYVRIRNIREISLETLSEMYSIQDNTYSVRESIDREPRRKPLLYVTIGKDETSDESNQEQIAEKCEGDEITIAEIELGFTFVDPPKSNGKTSSKRKQRKGKKTDHIKKSINDKNLGDRGEKFVIKVEKKKLMISGRTDLAEEVKHTSVEEGDGLGYDIKSFEVDPLTKDVKEIYIEVKTTRNNKMTPFFATRTEIEVSKEFTKLGTGYYVYRVFDFDLNKDEGKIFRIKGSILDNFSGEPEIYTVNIK